MEISRWDRFLCGLFPNWGMKRVESKAVLRSYEAAGAGRRTSGWQRSSSDANSAASGALAPLRELSRDLRRNNPWAKRGIEAISGNAVGTGLEAKAVGTGDELAKAALELWQDWAGRTSCDFDGRMKFSGLQRLVMDAVVESGECLIMKTRANSEDGLPVPVRIRILEPDYIDTRRHGAIGEGKGKVVQGIELDGDGRRVAYYVHAEHPGATGFPSLSRVGLASTRVPASDVIHIYRVDRPGQMRGIPWLCAAIARINDFGDYEDAKLMQAKIAALFAAFVSDMDGQAAALGKVDDDDEEIEGFEPGSVNYLKPGQEVTFPSPPSLSDLGEFTQSQLRAIAAGLGVTYEDLTGDYSQVNFSSSRMARLAHYNNIHKWRSEMLIPQLCEGVWRWVMGDAAALNEWPSIPRSEWTPPPMPMVSPEKEGRALTSLIRGGLMTLPQAIRERGEDPVAHMAEIAASNKALDDAKIILDSDPRNTSSSGGTQDAGGDSPVGD